MQKNIKVFFLLFFILTGLLILPKQISNASVVPPCAKGVCTSGSYQYSTCGSPYAGKVSESVCQNCALGICVGFTGCWSPWAPIASCGSSGGGNPAPTSRPQPTPAPVCGPSNCRWFCNTSCDEYNAICSGNTCVQDPNALIAKNTVDCSWLSRIGITCPKPPPDPTTLTVKTLCNLNASLAKFDFAGNSRIDHWQVRWRASGATWGSWHTTYSSAYNVNPTCTTGPGGCSFSYNILINWQVRACNDGGGCGSPVSGSNFRTNTCSAPSSLTATTSCNTTDSLVTGVFAWEKGDTNASSYNVYWSDGTTTTGPKNTTALTYSATNLAVDQSYSVWVRAVNASGVIGPATTDVNFDTPASCTTPPPPSASSWYQSIGGDVRQDDGISVALPTGQYFSASQATPVLDAGVIFTAQPSASFGGGTPNQNNWLAKNNSFSPLPPGIKTSYAFISANVQKLGETPISISAFPSTLASGKFVYKITGDLNITTGSAFTFPANGNYVFLVDGNLTIDRNIIVPQSSIAVFVVSKNITISPNVTDLEGIYSADQQFKFGTNGSRADTPLTVEGSIIGNADLSTNIPFVNLRDLGDVVNATTPSVKVVFRPDFVLHVPDLVKKPSYSVSEIAPVGGN